MIGVDGELLSKLNPLNGKGKQDCWKQARELMGSEMERTGRNIICSFQRAAGEDNTIVSRRRCLLAASSRIEDKVSQQQPRSDEKIQ